MVTDFSVHVLSKAIVSVCILIWDRNSAPWYEVANNISACITEYKPRFYPIMKNISLKISSEKTQILCGDIKPSSLRLKPSISHPLMGLM